MKKLIFQTVILGVIALSNGIAGEKIVIAHRGASGYLPEHSMETKAVSYVMGADYIEQDLVLTKDNRLVVLHDIFLDRVTNVADIFPDRKRSDGRYYVIDFTLAEIKQLDMTERYKIKNGKRVAVYPNRFPLGKSSFKVHTFEEEIELIQGMNKSFGKNVGLYPEIKSPAFHHAEGKDIALISLKILKKYGYDTRNSKIYFQCFEAKELKRIKNELFNQLSMNIPLVLLLPGSNKKKYAVLHNGEKFLLNDYNWDLENINYTEISEYADGIGPSYNSLVARDSQLEQIKITPMVSEAHKAGLVVHPYTFRSDKLPQYAASFDQLLFIFYFIVDIDGIFTDFPDKAVDFLNSFSNHTHK